MRLVSGVTLSSTITDIKSFLVAYDGTDSQAFSSYCNIPDNKIYKELIAIDYIMIDWW